MERDCDCKRLLEDVMSALPRHFLNEIEAAEYCGISHAHFKKKVSPDVLARDFHGKKVYSVDDLRNEMENAPPWHRSTKSKNVGTSTGQKAARAIVDRLEKSVSQTQTPHSNLRKQG